MFVRLRRRGYRSALPWALRAGLIVVGAELTARVVLGVPALRGQVAGEDDASWRLAWIARQATAPGIYYSFDTFDPTKGWRSRPGLRGAPAFAGKHVSTNHLGLRGIHDPRPGPPPPGGRVLLLGDSFTFGDEVNDDETFASELARRLPATEMLNFGVHGYGHDQMLVLLREQLHAVAPTHVLLFYVAADAIRNTLAFRDFAKPRFDLAGDRVLAAGGMVPSPIAVWRAEWRRSRLLDLFVMLRRVWRERTGAQDRYVHRITTALLAAVAAEVGRAGSEFWLIELPTPDESAPGRTTAPLHAGILADACRAATAAWCGSLRPAFAQGGGDRMPGAHWGPAGHRLIAAQIESWLSAGRPRGQP